MFFKYAAAFQLLFNGSSHWGRSSKVSALKLCKTVLYLAELRALDQCYTITKLGPSFLCYKMFLFV